MKNNMNKDEFVAYLRKRGLSVAEFYAMMGNWFNLTTDESGELLKKTSMYKNLKRGNDIC